MLGRFASHLQLSAVQKQVTIMIRTFPSQQRSHVGPKETGGMAGAVRTPANARLGIYVPRMFDFRGLIGRQFMGK